MRLAPTPRTQYRVNLTGMRTPLTVGTSQMKNTQIRLAPTPRTFNQANVFILLQQLMENESYHQWTQCHKLNANY